MACHSEADGDQKKRKRSEETELGRKHSKRRKDRPVAGNETAPNHVSAPPKNGAVTPEADNEGSDGRRTNGESGSKDKRRHKKSKAQELAANVVEPPVHVPIPQEVAIVAAESEDEDKLETVVNGQSMERSEGSQQLWRLSKPMGGRMSDIDPIFTADEK